MGFGCKNNDTPMAEGYYHTEESVTEYIGLAKDVNGGELIEKLKLHLPTGSTLLEIGTGPGTDWNILTKDYEVLGSDNSQEFLNHLISHNPSGRFLPLDAITLEDGLVSIIENQDSTYNFNEILKKKGLTHSIDYHVDQVSSRSLHRHSKRVAVSPGYG